MEKAREGVPSIKQVLPAEKHQKEYEQLDAILNEELISVYNRKS